jgi:hypothetical protein
MCESVDILERTLWRTDNGRHFGPVEKQTTKWIYDIVSRGVGEKSISVFAIVTI